MTDKKVIEKTAKQLAQSLLKILAERGTFIGKPGIRCDYHVLMENPLGNLMDKVSMQEATLNSILIEILDAKTSEELREILDSYNINILHPRQPRKMSRAQTAELIQAIALADDWNGVEQLLIDEQLIEVREDAIELLKKLSNNPTSPSTLKRVDAFLREYDAENKV